MPCHEMIENNAWTWTRFNVLVFLVSAWSQDDDRKFKYWNYSSCWVSFTIQFQRLLSGWERNVLIL